MRRVDFACFAKVHPLFKANSPVQRKQGLLKTFSSKTIATTFDVFTVLALPYCLIIMFYIFSPSSQALFQVPLLWNLWLHHPSSCVQWGTMERISRHLFWLKPSQLSPVCSASFPLQSSQISQAERAELQSLLLLPCWESLLGCPAGHLFLFNRKLLNTSLSSLLWGISLYKPIMVGFISFHCFVVVVLFIHPGHYHFRAIQEWSNTGW